MEATVKFFGKAYGFLTAGEDDYFFNMAGFREPVIRNGTLLYLPSKLEITSICTGTRVVVLQHQSNPKGLCATEWTLASLVQAMQTSLHCLVNVKTKTTEQQDQQRKLWLRVVEQIEVVAHVGTAEECNALLAASGGNGKVVPVGSFNP